MGRPTDDAGAYLPTPQEIAERAAEIRRGWSEKTHAARWARETRVPTEVREYHDPAARHRRGRNMAELDI